ncbi:MULTISPECIES: hypothetical protein [unclassified Streptomyces]|uniref:hypothetical protein n=1 Tax=unclassified Streptomyces TaxID=2593676 RepID=UPI00325260B2
MTIIGALLWVAGTPACFQGADRRAQYRAIERAAFQEAALREKELCGCKDIMRGEEFQRGVSGFHRDSVLGHEPRAFIVIEARESLHHTHQGVGDAQELHARAVECNVPLLIPLEEALGLYRRDGRVGLDAPGQERGRRCTFCAAFGPPRCNQGSGNGENGCDRAQVDHVHGPMLGDKTGHEGGSAQVDETRHLFLLARMRAAPAKS